MFLEISQNSQENTWAREFCEISKNTFFTEHLWATASEHTPLQYTQNTDHVKSSVIAQKKKFSIKYFFSKCDQICRELDLITFIEEILKGKLCALSDSDGGNSLPRKKKKIQNKKDNNKTEVDRNWLNGKKVIIKLYHWRTQTNVEWATNVCEGFSTCSKL